MKIPFLKKLSEKERKILYSTIIIGCLALFYQYLLEPGCAQIKELNDEITTKQDSKELDDRIRSLKNRILQEYEHYQDYMVPLKEPAMENRKLSELIGTLAREAQVTINDLKTPTGKEVRATLDCEGKITAIITFIYNLTYTKQLLKIEKIDLSLKTPKEDTIKCYITVSKIKIP